MVTQRKNNEESGVCNHVTPCTDLSSFKKLVIGILGIQTSVVIVCLSLCVNAMSGQARANQKIMQVSTRQEIIEKKADSASSDASRALAISGKTESDITWIRDGLGELKMIIRNGSYTTRPKTP